MTKSITKQFLVRSLNRIARIAWNLECNDKFAASLVKAGLKSKRFKYLGTYLSSVGHLMAKFEPVTTEPRRCVVCSNIFIAHLDHPRAISKRYCSSKCRYRAYVKRHATTDRQINHARKHTPPFDREGNKYRYVQCLV
jgi:hypothetical protein